MHPSLDLLNVTLALVNTEAHVRGSPVYFTTFQRNGVIAMAVAALISCSFVTFLLLYILITALLFWRQQKPTSSAPFIRKQVVVYVVCLLVADLIQSISGVLQIKWARERRLYEGVACTVQAVTLTMGDLGSTVWSSVIAAHTFSSVALGKQWSRTTLHVTVVTGWLFVVTLTIVGPIALQTTDKGPFYGIAGDWCFITTDYAIDRLVIHYVPLFIAAVLIPVLYGLVFLVLRGRINFLTHRVHLAPMRLDDAVLRERIVIAKRMLWYPIAYVFCISPMAIIRLCGLKENNIPDGVWIFGVVILFSLGAIDSVIYATTRKLVKPIKFPMPLRRFNGDVWTPHMDNFPASQKLDSNHGSRTDSQRTLDMNQYIPCDKERANKIGSLPHEQEPTSCMSAIHITTERIEEVR